MLKVMFVDDEPHVLRGLRRLLNFMNEEWAMEFVGGGTEALALMEREAVDVIVTDIIMPGMNGAQLLAQVLERWPGTVRIILSGHSDREVTLRSVGTAHQFLAKPCEPELLVSTISRVCTLGKLLNKETLNNEAPNNKAPNNKALNNEALRQLVQGMRSLPSQPALYNQILGAFQQPDTSMQKISDLVNQDAGMTARILQLVNSAFFGQPRHISSAAQAISLLGLDMIRALVLSFGVFSPYEPGLETLFSLEKLWQHGMCVGKFAKEIARSEGQSCLVVEDAFAAGLLHDVGKLILAANMPNPYAEALALTQTTMQSLEEAERATIGATHAEVGAYLMGLWGLPNSIVEALAYHHKPLPVHGTTFCALTAVHAANCLAHELDGAGDSKNTTPLNEDYLLSLGLSHRIPIWRESCRTLQ